MLDSPSLRADLDLITRSFLENYQVPRSLEKENQRRRHATLAARLLEGLMAAGNPSARPVEELSRPLEEKKVLTLQEAFQELPPSRQDEIHAKLGSDFVKSIIQISRSVNPKIFSKEIDSLANDYLSLGRLMEAAFLYSSLLDFTPPEFSELRNNYQRRLNGMQGVGDATDRFQFQAGQFWRQTFEGVSLGSIAGAQFIFGVGRWGFAKGLPRAVPALWGRLGKTGRLTLAGIPAFGLETLGFAGLQRGLGNLAGHPESGLSFIEEWKHGAWNLGFLKTFMGGASVWMGRGYAGVLPAQLKLRDRLIQATVPQGAMMGGIYTAHALAPHFGIGEHREDPTHGIDTLVFWAQFNLSGFALNRIPGWKKMNSEILRLTDLEVNSHRGFTAKPRLDLNGYLNSFSGLGYGFDIGLGSNGIPKPLKTVAVIAGMAGLTYLGLKIFRTLPTRPKPLDLPLGSKRTKEDLSAINQWYRLAIDPYLDPYIRGRNLFILRNTCKDLISGNDKLTEHFLQSIRKLLLDQKTYESPLLRIRDQILLNGFFISYRKAHNHFLNELHLTYLQFLQALPENSLELRRGLEIIPSLLDRAAGNRKRTALIFLMFATIQEKVSREDPQIKSVVPLFNEIISKDPYWHNRPSILEEMKDSVEIKSFKDYLDLRTFQQSQESDGLIEEAFRKINRFVKLGIFHLPRK